ncbi:cupredoxin domain-containing protein [Paenibacillus harenae]|uniref:cupredoxin domain-containing protein n=1 Tax=Paenibacillus harenae TaxID=306543 RepID=UPI0027945F54|nr:cupredoxin domain-containing protein [Paenibacillus harenae]MDQ0059762.1 cytochrome c oxidase subunit 2 [Paenibacillus harenae]
MKKKLALTLTVTALAAVMALSGCGGGNNTNNNNGGTTPPAGENAGEAGGEGGGETKSITVNAANFEFDPPDIKLNAGDKVTITLKNDTGNHGLEIPDFDVNLKNGESATFTVDKAGSYDFHCSIQCGSGHADMVGKLTVS